jgi:hypothetical protein
VQLRHQKNEANGACSNLEVALKFRLVAGQLRGGSGEQSLGQRFDFFTFQLETVRLAAT